MPQIKPFTGTDLEFKEIVRIQNLVHHDSIDHPDDLKRSWILRDTSKVSEKQLLYQSGKLIGVVHYTQGRNQNKHNTYFNIYLDPSYNNNGYREILYHKMLSEVKKYNSDKLFPYVYDHPNYDHYKKFLEAKGFTLTQTNREYSCNIKDIKLDKYKPLIKKLESEGIIFYDSKKEMLQFPKHYEKLEELVWTYSNDYPMPDGIEHTRAPFDQFMKRWLDFYENSYGTEIVAVKNEQYIGSTDISVFSKSEPHKGWTGGLGVLKKFRRKGIATAIKIKAIEVLKDKGIKEIRTDNEENNPMYKINVALGFKPVPFSLDYVKEI